MPLLIIVLLFILLTDGSDKKTQVHPKPTKQIEAMETKMPRHGGVAGGWYNTTFVGNEYGCNKGGF